MSATPLISIVDDDDSLRNSLNNLIRSVGFRAQGFSSAEAFLNSQQLHDTACLIDVRMPGMSGLDLQRQMVATTRESIVFIPSRSDDNARTRALKPARWIFCTNLSGKRHCLRQ
jgi:FixJ family two-component response regulator